MKILWLTFGAKAWKLKHSIVALAVGVKDIPSQITGKQKQKIPSEPERGFSFVLHKFIIFCIPKLCL
jgi:hypothetical protein